MNSKPEPGQARHSTHDGTDWQKAVTLPSFRHLIQQKKKLLIPMVVIYLTVFMGMTLLAGFARDFMTQKVFGAINMGYLLVFLCYLMCWVMGVVYVRIANSDFDLMAVAAIADLKAQKGMS